MIYLPKPHFYVRISSRTRQVAREVWITRKEWQRGVVLGRERRDNLAGKKDFCMVQLQPKPRNRQKAQWKAFEWDRCSKALIKEHPQEMVDFLVPGARFICFREGQFQTEVGSPFEPRDTRSDVMMETEHKGKRFLLHIELQSTKDKKMDERLLGYRCDAVRLHGLEVWSCVIYLRRVNDLPRPPMRREVWKGQQTVHFNYRSIELAFQPVDELRQYNLDVLQPLMLLCKGGAKREVLDEVLIRLKEHNKSELISLTRIFAGLVFRSEADKAWLRRRFAVLQDYLREHSWTFKETLEEGRAEGGVAATRRSIEAFVQKRFPALLALVKSKIVTLTDQEKLESFLLTISLAQTEGEARKVLATLA
jgi:hypothetical protein